MAIDLRKILKSFCAAIVFGLLFSGCAVFERVGIKVFFKEATLPTNQILKNISYQKGSDSAAQRLDLFLPAKTNWPVVIFVHGGGWDSGDKNLRVGGADVYGNIGRYFAARGVGVAVINYRLQPQVQWRDQATDVASAVAWVHSHIAQYSGDARRIFLMGHSAGAQLAAHVALHPTEFCLQPGAPLPSVVGVISISGAALDLSDAQTYALGEKISYYETRFRDRGLHWKEDASPINFITPRAPPFLVLYASGERKPFQRQSRLFNDALLTHGGKSKLIVVPGQSHARIVLTLSRDDKIAGPAILNFIETTRSPAPSFQQ